MENNKKLNGGKIFVIFISIVILAIAIKIIFL